MYKLLIADDEDIIRKGIAESTTWEEFGFQLVGQAADGEEAWTFVTSNRPDLIISDIYMPRMNGIELAEKTKANYPETVIVFLSGYNDFNYARKSIELGIFRYLTKPVQVQELREILREVKSELEYKMGEADRQKKLMEQVQESLPLLREKLLRDLIKSRVEEDELGEALKFLDLKIVSGAFIVILISIDDYHELIKQHKGSEFYLLKLLLMNTLRERFAEEYCQSFVFESEDNEITVLYGFDPVRIRDVQGHLYSLIGNIQLTVKTQIHVSISASISDEAKLLMDLSECYVKAKSAMDYKIVAGKNSILHYNDIKRIDHGRIIFPLTKEDELGRYIRSGDTEAALECARLAFEQIRKSRLIKRSHFYVVVSEMVNRVIRIALQPSDGYDGIFGKGYDPYAEIYTKETLEDMEAWFEEIVKKVAAYFSSKIRASTKSFIDKAREYISKNYMDEELSLHKIAENVFISPCYLSQVFNQVTGESIVDYIMGVRIEKAKELLRDKAKKSYEIAYEVGFKDAHYFSSCFKKIVGTAPSEYREYVDFDIK